jgi:hypothetical protein
MSVAPTTIEGSAPYTTADANLKLRVTIDYEDEAGYQWRRTDTGQPRRTDEEAQFGGGGGGLGTAADD